MNALQRTETYIKDLLCEAHKAGQDAPDAPLTERARVVEELLRRYIAHEEAKATTYWCDQL